MINFGHLTLSLSFVFCLHYFDAGKRSYNDESSTPPGYDSTELAVLSQLLDQNCHNCRLDTLWSINGSSSTFSGPYIKFELIDSVQYVAELDLASFGLTGEIKDLYLLKRLSRLIVRDNELDAVGKLVRMSRLVYLDFSENLIQHMDSFSDLPRLNTLSLSGNPDLDSLPTGLEQIRSVAELQLSNTGLDSLPNLNTFPNLERLRINGTDIAEVVFHPDSLPDLYLLTANHCRELTTLPDLSGTGIFWLELMNCHKIQTPLSLPPGMRNFWVESDSLPSIAGLGSLTEPNQLYIVAPNIPITDIPTSFNQYASTLSLLAIRRSKLKHPPAYDQCSLLTQIDFASNDSMEIDTLDFSNFPLLTSIYCYNTAIQAIAPMDSNPAITHIQLINCGLQQLPSLSNCKKLKVLQIPGNPLHHLQDLDSFPNLLNLDISDCQLTTAPRIPPCPQLLTLEVDGNQFTETGWNLRNCNLARYWGYGTNFTFEDAEHLVQNNPNVQLSIGGGDPIVSSPRDSVLELDGGSDTLGTANAGGINGVYEWFINDENHPIVGATGPTLTLSDSMAFHKRAEIFCRITHQTIAGTKYTERKAVYFDEGVRCDDMNGDGAINILDIIGIGYAYGRTGFARPNAVMDPGRLQPSYAWRDSIPYNGQQRDLKNFDADGNGVLDDNDDDCLLPIMQPLKWTTYHQNLDTSHAFKLNAWCNPAKGDLEKLNDTTCVLTYHIDFAGLPYGLQSMDVKGCIFVRTEAQDNCSDISGMWAEFGDSKFQSDTNRVFMVDKFYPTDSLSTTQFPAYDLACTDVVHNPLEVAVWSKDSATTVTPGMRLVDCKVIMTVGDYRQACGKMDSLPIMFDTYNVVLFAEDKNNDWQPILGQCTKDTTYIPPWPKDAMTTTNCPELHSATVDILYGENVVFLGYVARDTTDITMDVVSRKTGQSVWRKTVHARSGYERLDISGFPKGAYDVTFSTCGQVTCTGDFARKGIIGKLLYYLFRHQDSRCN